MLSPKQTNISDCETVASDSSILDLLSPEVSGVAAGDIIGTIGLDLLGLLQRRSANSVTGNMAVLTTKVTQQKPWRLTTG